jgi:hypothetical protein
MRAWLARRIVKEVSFYIETAYMANCHKQRRVERFFGRVGIWHERVLFPIARRLDKEAMVDQMIAECWWG